MKTKRNQMFFFAAFLSMLSSFIAFSNGKPTPEKNSIVIEVPRMVCGGCANKIENAFKSTKGVLKVNANFKEKIVTVDFNPSIVSSANVVKVITNLGYETKVK